MNIIEVTVVLRHEGEALAADWTERLAEGEQDLAYATMSTSATIMRVTQNGETVFER